MKYLPIILLGIAFQAASAEQPSGSSWQQIVDEGIRSCNSKQFKTVGEKDACIEKHTEKARELYPRRGSNQYAEKHYAGLSKAQAEKVLQDLQREWEAADRGGYFSARSRGDKVSQHAISEEGWWIQTNIFGTDKSMGDPWFIECKGFKTTNVIRRCPLGKGGEE